MEDFRKPFKDGGLTLGQVIVLFKHADHEEFNRLKIQAKLHGCSFDDGEPADDEPSSAATNTRARSSRAADKALLFKDPAAYSHMSEEEKEALTQKMMTKWKRWANQQESEVLRCRTKS